MVDLSGMQLIILEEKKDSGIYKESIEFPLSEYQNEKYQNLKINQVMRIKKMKKMKISMK